MAKAGAQRYAAELGIALVVPDTSPRNTGIPGEDSDWDLGSGAGFFVNATEPPWSEHYHMFDYVVEELPALLAEHFPIEAERAAVSGHSMGGHGALVVALRNPERYRSVSAFSPICAPSACPWGQKALGAYLGPDRGTWRAYDATCLVRDNAPSLPLLVDQGDADAFLAEQLRPEGLREACAERQWPLQLRLQPGYDHSYYFVTTFIGEHLRYHADALAA